VRFHYTTIIMIAILATIAMQTAGLSAARVSFYANAWYMTPAAFATKTAGLHVAHLSAGFWILTANGVSAQYLVGESCFANAAGDAVLTDCGWTVLTPNIKTYPGELPQSVMPDWNRACSNATSPGNGPGQWPPSPADAAALAKWKTTHPTTAVSAAQAKMNAGLLPFSQPTPPVVSADVVRSALATKPPFMVRTKDDNWFDKLKHWFRIG
jgi:hypothetical protein